MNNNPKPYIWISAGIVIFIIIAIYANRREDIPQTKRLAEKVESAPQTAIKQEKKVISTEFLTRYAGEYEILVDDFFTAGVHEKLLLYSNGECTWQWVENAFLQSTKYGFC